MCLEEVTVRTFNDHVSHYFAIFARWTKTRNYTMWILTDAIHYSILVLKNCDWPFTEPLQKYLECKKLHMKSRRFILGQQNLYSNGEHRRSVVGKVTLMVSMPQTERELKGDDSGSDNQNSETCKSFVSSRSPSLTHQCSVFLQTDVLPLSFTCPSLRSAAGRLAH